MSIPIKKIMVPTDGSVASVTAARWAAALAASIDASLVLIHVATLGEARVDAERRASANGGSGPNDVEDAIIKATLTAMGPVSAPVQELHAYGDPVREVVYQAEHVGADLIVVGNRGLSPIKELLLGSVSDGIARHAKVPVTIVR